MPANVRWDLIRRLKVNLFKSVIYISGDKFAHSQEHFLTVYPVFGKMQCNDKL